MFLTRQGAVADSLAGCIANLTKEATAAGMPVWLLPTIIATVGSIIVIVMTLREWRATGGGIGRSAAALHDIPCTLCRRSMHIQRADLKPLTGVEVGLVVQAI